MEDGDLGHHGANVTSLAVGEESQEADSATSLLHREVDVNAVETQSNQDIATSRNTVLVSII
jgi:hypothetical protein